jgi:hypothetical protein
MQVMDSFGLVGVKWLGNYNSFTELDIIPSG